MAKHTTGRITRDTHDSCIGRIGAAIVLDAGSDLHLSPRISAANARRLVAGWNLLERLGLSTSQIEDALALTDDEFNGWLSEVLTNRYDAVPAQAKGNTPA